MQIKPAFVTIIIVHKGRLYIMKKSKLLIIAVLVCVSLLFIFPIEANGSLAELRLYYYPYGEDGADLVYTPIVIPARFNTLERAEILFTIFFEDSAYRMTFTPMYVQVLAIFFCDDTKHLTLDVSSQILSYGGGTYFEEHLTNRLLRNAQGLGAVYFTLLIESELRYLPEGTLLNSIFLEDF